MNIGTPLHLKLGPQGRVVIPALLRQELGLATGDELVVAVDDGRLVMESRRGRLARLQAKVQAAAGTKSLAGELLEERRKEAKHEASSLHEPATRSYVKRRR